MLPTLEVGAFLNCRHRLSLLARLDIADYAYAENGVIQDWEDGDTLSLALRYAHFFPVKSRVHPYAGVGFFWGSMRHNVETAGSGGTLEGGLVSPDMEDSYLSEGGFVNGLAGVRLCLTNTCSLGLQVEFNWLWQWLDSQGDTLVGMEVMKRFAFWFSAGVGVQF